MNTPEHRKRYKNKRNSWIEEYIEAAEELGAEDEAIPVDVYLDFLIKTPYGLWKELEASDIGKAPTVDIYASGASRQCGHCATTFRSHAKEPECPFCHRRA